MFDDTNRGSEKPVCASEFEVLLGVLKKIESKSASMLTNAAVLIAFVAIISDFFDPDVPKFTIGQLSLNITLFLLLWILWLSILGQRQLDNADLHTIDNGAGAIGNTLFRKLFEDCLRKERYFRLSCILLRISIFLIFLYVLASLFIAIKNRELLALVPGVPL